MRRSATRLIGGIVMAVAVAGCGDGVTLTGSNAADDQLTCGEDPFPISALDAPAGVETQLDDPAVQTLNEIVGTRAGLKSDTSLPVDAIDPQFPATGWRQLVRTDKNAVFVAEPVEADGGLRPMVTLLRDQRASTETWSYGGHGRCAPRWYRPDEWSGWALAPDGMPSPDATEFTLLVSDPRCSGGKRLTPDRINSPEIEYTPDAIMVTMSGDHLPNGMYTCQGVQPTEVTITLDEPLGDRQLLDGSYYPPRPPHVDPTIGVPGG